nr:ErfK/YbiS/YcfS/YnhG family protein [uncultured bacterium]
MPAPSPTPEVPSASPTPSPQQASSDAPFTMPLLDALLDDQEFVADAKKTVSLTDQELQKLRTAADENLSTLDENEKGQRSARGSSDSAKEKVKEILGRDRGEQFISLVGKEWAGETPNGSESGNVPSDTRVVVNIPAFRMDVFDKGKLVKTYKIGIGYPEFPLPIGVRKAKQIIINPSWTPPDEPWVKGKVRPHEKVEAGSKLNPLGPIKIPIGGPSLIHGGKSPNRLGTFASHGCVGLTDQQVEDFAIQISSIAGKPITIQDIKGYETKRDETKTIDLGKDVAVELRYETIVVENGVLKIYRDVYERGTNTEDNLRRVLDASGVSLDKLDDQLKTNILNALQMMNTDAAGRPVDGTIPGQWNANVANSNRSEESKKPPKITGNIKGKKEFSFPIAQLAGKGYPAALP